MKKSFDLKNLQCPKPVLETKKIIEQYKGNEIEIILNSSISKENVIRFLSSCGITPSVKEEGEHIFITFSNSSTNIPEVDEKSICSFNNLAKNIIISSKTLGKGDDKLGEILMKTFIYTLSERDVRPKTIFFVNSGVFLTTEGSPVVEELKKLIEGGTEIYSCGTCLDFFNLKDNLVVGKIGNMALLIDLLWNEGIML